jgi:hypothetical protein
MQGRACQMGDTEGFANVAVKLGAVAAPGSARKEATLIKLRLATDFDVASWAKDGATQLGACLDMAAHDGT